MKQKGVSFGDDVDFEDITINGYTMSVGKMNTTMPESNALPNYAKKEYSVTVGRSYEDQNKELRRAVKDLGGALREFIKYPEDILSIRIANETLDQYKEVIDDQI